MVGGKRKEEIQVEEGSRMPCHDRSRANGKGRKKESEENHL
jgi:hypothetical protein